MTVVTRYAAHVNALFPDGTIGHTNTEVPYTADAAEFGRALIAAFEQVRKDEPNADALDLNHACANEDIGTWSVHT